MNLFASKNDYVVIVGCGRLGVNLANELYNNDVDVLVIDKCERALRNLSSGFGGLTIIGSGTDIDVLQRADLHKANAVVVVTDDDNVNIMTALMAKEMFGVKKVIARLLLPEKETIYRDHGIETFCPTMLSMKIVQNLLKDPETYISAPDKERETA